MRSNLKRLAALEENPSLKADFENQAKAYRKLAAERTKKFETRQMIGYAMKDYQAHLEKLWNGCSPMQVDFRSGYRAEEAGNV